MKIILIKVSYPKIFHYESLKKRENQPFFKFPSLSTRLKSLPPHPSPTYPTPFHSSPSTPSPWFILNLSHSENPPNHIPTDPSKNGHLDNISHFSSLLAFSTPAVPRPYKYYRPRNTPNPLPSHPTPLPLRSPSPQLRSTHTQHLPHSPPPQTPRSRLY